MWRSIFAVLLLPSLTAAQTGSVPAVQTDVPGTKSFPNASRPRPIYEAFSFYDGIRRGTAEDVAISVSSEGFLTTPRSPVPGIIPLKLDLDPIEGLTVSQLRYPKADKLNAKFHANPIAIARMDSIQFKVRASQKASLGLHVLTGKLTFQPVHFDATVGPVQQVDVMIPVTIVEHDAKVRRQQWPIRHMSVAMIVVIILLLPVLIPLIPLIYLICAAEGSPGCG
jgi:hypothetical protein